MPSILGYREDPRMRAVYRLVITILLTVGLAVGLMSGLTACGKYGPLDPHPDQRPEYPREYP